MMHRTIALLALVLLASGCFGSTPPQSDLPAFTRFTSCDFVGAGDLPITCDQEAESPAPWTTIPEDWVCDGSGPGGSAPIQFQVLMNPLTGRYGFYYDRVTTPLGVAALRLESQGRSTLFYWNETATEQFVEFPDWFDLPHRLDGMTFDLLVATFTYTFEGLENPRAHVIWHWNEASQGPGHDNYGFEAVHKVVANGGVGHFYRLFQTPFGTATSLAGFSVEGLDFRFGVVVDKWASTGGSPPRSTCAVPA